MATGAEIATLADKLGIHREIVQGYSNQHQGALPPTLAALEQWGDTPDWAYGIKRRNNGAWTPLGKGSVSRPDIKIGDRNEQFRTIENLEDFMNMYPFPDPSGVGAKLAAGDPAALQQFSKGGDSAVGPTPEQVTNAATLPPQQRAQVEQSNNWAPGSLGGDAAPAPAAAPAAGGAQPAAAPYQGSTSAGAPQLTNPAIDSMLVSLMNNAAQIAYNNKRLELDRDIFNQQTIENKEKLAQAAAAQAAKEVQDRAVATGTYPDGTPTLAATQQGADLTGFDPASSLTARASAGFNRLAPDQRTGANAAAIWQSLVPGLTPEQAMAMNNAAHQYYAANGATMPEDVARQTLGQITGRPPTSFGQLTPAAQHLQNVDANAILDTLSRLRGPENAFVYAQTLANVPESIRGAVQAAMARMPVSGQNPAQAGVLGDLGAGQQPTGGPTQQLMGATTPAVGPTAAIGNTMRAAAGIGPAADVQQVGGGLRAAPGTFPGVQGASAVGGPALPPAPPGFPVSTPVVPPVLATLPVAQPGAIPPVGAVPPVAPLPAMIDPSQLSPTDMARTPEYLRKVLFAGYEAHGGQDGRGMDLKDAQDRYLRSLPVASQGGPTRGRLRVA